jgi:hypothetical protein
VQYEGGTLEREDRAGARGGREQQGALLTHRWFSVWLFSGSAPGRTVPARHDNGQQPPFNPGQSAPP